MSLADPVALHWAVMKTDIPSLTAMLEGRFLAVQQSIGVPKGRAAGLGYLRGIVEDAKASGLVARAIAQTGARGVSVAPRV